MMKKESAFTLIEITIVLALIVLTLWPFYLLGVYSYRQFIKVHQESGMKTDVVNIKLMIESDLARGGKFFVNPDHHGIKINVSGREKTYLFKDEAIYLKNGNKEARLTGYPVNDGLWIFDEHMISMNIEYRYKTVIGSDKYFKVIRDIEL